MNADSSTTIGQLLVRTDWFFLLTSLFTIAAGMLSVTRRNPVYAALWLMASFAGMAGLFFRLDARFLAAIQVLVYAGAIMVLFLFVIMLLALRPEELGKEPAGPARLAAAVVSFPRRESGVTVQGGLPPGLDVSDRASMHEWLRRQR
jgi:hypothetical protein